MQMDANCLNLAQSIQANLGQEQSNGQLMKSEWRLYDSAVILINSWVRVGSGDPGNGPGLVIFILLLYQLQTR